MKRYALFQHAQTALDVDALKEAFAACDGLTAHDGRTAAAHSSGSPARDAGPSGELRREERVQIYAIEAEVLTRWDLR